MIQARHALWCRLLHQITALVLVKKFKKISKRNLPNAGTAGWMETLADKVHKQGEHIPQHCYISHNHPYISSSAFLLEIFLNLLFLLFFVTRCRPSTCGWCVIRARAPTNGVQQLVHSAPTIEKRWSYVTVTLKTKFGMHTPSEFPGYWWLFWMQHLSH